MMLETVRVVGFGVCGVFTVVLGLVHFTMPRLFDFDGAIPTEGAPLKPLSLRVVSYQTKRSDVRGIAQIMNHAVSYALVTIGVVDLLVERWYTAGFAPYLLAWLAGWWFLRATHGEPDRRLARRRRLRPARAVSPRLRDGCLVVSQSSRRLLGEATTSSPGL